MFFGRINRVCIERIHCIREQIGVFLISTRAKLLNSPICSRIELTFNCFSNKPISFTNSSATLYKFDTVIAFKIYERMFTKTKTLYVSILKQD